MKQNEKRVVMAVFDSLVHMPFAELNKMLGSITIQEMNDLYHRLKYEDYCKRHHVRYEDMTEYDFESFHEEECDRREAEIGEYYDRHYEEDYDFYN